MQRGKGIVLIMICLSLWWSGEKTVWAATPSSLPPSAQPLPAEMALSLEESIHLALQNNLDLHIERFGPQIQATTVGVEQSAFDPSLTLRSRIAREREGKDAPASFPNEGVSDEKIVEVEGRLEQRLPTGSRYTLRFQEERLDSNESGAGRTINPTHTQSLRLSFRQSLLRNFGYRVNTTPIRLARNNQRISEHVFRQRVIDIVTQVEELYWNLVLRKEELKVEEQQLRLAQDLLQKARVQVEVGTLASLDLLQAEAEVASLQGDVIIAQNRVATANDRLKAALNLPQTLQDWEVDIIPTDQPDFVSQPLSVDTAIETAFLHRPDYRQAQIDIENRSLQLRFRKNQLYPLLDLNGSVGLNNRLEEEFADALDSTFSGKFFSWEVGLTLQIPLGNREARNRFTRAKLEASQALTALKRLEQQIIVEVREAVRNVRASQERVATTRLARELAEKQLAAEEKKLAVGLSSVRNVLELQRDLAVARRNEIQALIDYRLALATLAKAQGITLDVYHLTLE
ncbi:MAG: TolC family protein [Nitrospinota bacterium]|nr:MAG: TolC family protein [Nitrospinota bacterium]